MTADPPWLEQAVRLPLAFAQVREDPLLDREVVEATGRRLSVLVVASGGCTAALLASLPAIRYILLIDPNPAQLVLARLKLELLRRCSTSQRLAILGHRNMAPEERHRRISALLSGIDPEAGALGPADLVARRGPDHAGRYEALFAALRRALAAQRSRLDTLLELADPVRQRHLLDGPLRQALDQALDRVFDLPVLVRLFGPEATRNPAEPFGTHFARRLVHVLTHRPARHNPWLRQMLGGRYPSGCPAPWFTARAPVDPPRIEWVRSTMLEVLRDSGEIFDFIHLSNILDWLSPQEAARTLDGVAGALRPGGKVLVRQLNSRLDIRRAGSRFAWMEEDSDRLLAADRSFFYRAIHLGRRR